MFNITNILRKICNFALYCHTRRPTDNLGIRKMVDTSNTSNTKRTEAKPRKMAVKETKKASLKPADEKPSCILRILVTGRWLMAFAVVFFYGTWYLVDCFCDYVKSSMPRKVQEVEYCCRAWIFFKRKSTFANSACFKYKGCTGCIGCK